jgi:hypothetical protein
MVRHHLLGGADVKLLARVGLDRGQSADLDTVPFRGAGQGDDLAPAIFTGGNPLRPRIDLDHLDPEGRSPSGRREAGSRPRPTDMPRPEAPPNCSTNCSRSPGFASPSGSSWGP